MSSGAQSGASATSGQAGSGDATAPPPSGGYSVQGATIYDSNGKPHLFHGLDRPSLEWSASGDHLSLGDYQNMASWKANVVRIALNQDFWLSDSPSYSGSYSAVVDQQIGWAESAGMDVVLDLHWSDKGDYSVKPAQQRMADAHSLMFWSQVAARYKSDPRVLFELYNEPHDVSWEVWLSGGASGDGFTVAGMQQLYQAVRSGGAQNLVVVGGLQYAFDLSGVPTHRVQGTNIVYATHPYQQTGKDASTWDGAFGFLTKTDPVMATEFGASNSACPTTYDSQLISYADAHNMSWSAWAWYKGDCTFPALISDWAPTLTPPGQVVKTALAAY